MAKRESFGSTLDKELLSDLRKLSEDTDVPISKLLDRAVKMLLETRGMQRDSKRVVNQRTDDKYHIDINLD